MAVLSVRRTPASRAVSRASNLPHTLVPVASWGDILDTGDGGARGAGSGFKSGSIASLLDALGKGFGLCEPWFLFP